MMFAEYALLPCIFDRNNFKDQKIGELHLKNLKEILLHEESLVRDLYGGKWRQSINNIDSKFPCTKSLLMSLSQRLHRVKAAKAHNPENYMDWCNEALSSHKEDALDGIIASPETIKNFQTETLIASVENLYEADWWTNRSHSVGLDRKTGDYLKCLKRILNYANSIIFIDPYLDVFKPEYQEFSKILEAINRSDDPPTIEIHICHLNSISPREYEQDFRQRLTSVIQSQKLSVEVFIWDKFHDRYIISNLGGIQSGHSFGVSDHPSETTTWTRISRTRRDELQKEFDRNSNCHKSQHRFVVEFS